ncbi:hypothetical protein T265_00614 [Opisthorchis viverrini]|uniref:Uncharacterized protein n=1 Tax=Opisthorchis viverrini TaxID=6198 RepID=A0A075A191_OPIVI|nr:hypothetical protein T265_00614 [Opisthorchis viverrini]KER33498.1 hypothetical protein T265_00614 [Opisthorchis viverrini]
MIAPALFSGVVKQVLSGDSIVIRDRPVDGPPPERTIVLSNISCGRVARRPTPNNPSGGIEDPFAWQAREFVRSRLVGKEVCYTVDTELPTGRKYGCVYLGKSTAGENIARSLVEAGLAEVRRLNAALAEKNPQYQELLAAEEAAKSTGRGKWSPEPTGAVREVIWNIEDPRAFIDAHKGQRIPGVVEYVRDGSSLQVTLLPGPSTPPHLYYNVMLSLSGIKAPTIRFEDGKQVAEPFGLDAQFFVESRLLQREVVILFESCNNQTFIGSVLHPNGNIAEVLVREGLAKCVEWNLNLVSVPGASDVYRAAERMAKEKRLRLWRDYQPPMVQMETPEVRDPNRLAPGTTFVGNVVEVGNGDNISIKCSDGIVRRFFLSSIRLPRPSVPSKDEEESSTAQRTRYRPLYDVPYMFEAREQLRAFVGKSVTAQVDYIQPKTATTVDERVCCTVRCGSTNISESLVSKGLATVIRYRNANDARSSAYSDLLNAEEQAQTKGLGLHSKSDPPVHRVADLTGNLAKSRQFLPFLKRTPRFNAVVEFVVHASRMRVFLPSETCLVTLLLSGIQCPRRGRPKPDGTDEPDMPFSIEGYNLVRELCMQRNVEVTIETIDRVGNFVGWMFVDAPPNESSETDAPKSTGKKKKKAIEAAISKTKANLSVLLVSRGLATVHHAPATEASPYYHDLVRAEDAAKAGRIGLWSSEEFVKQWEAELNSFTDSANADGADDGRILSGVSGYLDDLSALSLNGHSDDQMDEHATNKIKWKPAQITGVSNPGAGSEGLRFFAQHSADSGTIVQISHSLNAKQSPPPLPGYQPKKGELCAACFSVDNCWYRARVVRCSPKSITVMFIDFGNEETVDLADAAFRLSPLPPGPLVNIPPQAHEYRLAFIQLPPDSTDRAFAERAFAEHVENKEVLLADQFGAVPCANETMKPVPGVALKIPNTAAAGGSSVSASAWIDVAQRLLEEGLVCVEPMRPDLLKQVSRATLSGYLEAQAKAKKERKNVWRYGDFRVDLGA